MDNLTESKVLFHFFDLFWDFIPEFCPPRFKVVSSPYLHNLKICFFMELFFVKSYEWSLSLKIPVIMVRHCFLL